MSWIRHRDLHILSVGAATYTSDDRFLVVPDKVTGDWALRLMYARPRDSGQYDCQVSSTPAFGRTIHLEIIGEGITQYTCVDTLVVDTTAALYTSAIM